MSAYKSLIVRALFYGVIAFAGGSAALLGSHFLNSKKDRAYNNDRSVATLVSANNLNTGAIDLSVAAAKAMPSVVHIYAAQTRGGSRRQQYDFWGFPLEPQKREGTGSGVIISEDGYIVTNNHVVDDADDIEVTLVDKQKFKATLIGRDPSTDLAVLKIKGSRFRAIEKGDSDQLRIGQWVLAIGNPAVGYDSYGRPKQLNSTVTAGIVSAKSRDIGISEDRNSIEAFIQTDAVVNPGNSGGALVNDKGELVGINTAIATTNGRYQGYSFAIPVNLMNKVIEDIIQFGTYKRVFLGVEIRELDHELAKELKVNVSKGVVVEGTTPGGSAERGGLKVHDIIVGVNGKSIDGVPALQEVVSSSRIGQTLKINIIRGGKPLEINVPLIAQKG